MNILFVADVSIADIIGGAERALFEQSSRLSQKGHRIHIITRRLPWHDQDHEIIEGIEEWRYDYNPSNPAAFIKSIWFNARWLFELLHQKYHFDCVNFHQPFTASGINYSEISRGLLKIYTCHSLSFEEYLSRRDRGNGITRIASTFFQVIGRKKIEKNVLHESNVIVVLSQFTQIKLIKTYKIPKAKIQIIQGGVDLNKFHPADEKTEARARLNIPQHKIVLFTVRNLVRRMGLENLIVAIKELLIKMEDIYLVIGGSGPLKDELNVMLKNLKIEDKVNLIGFIPENQLPLYYQMADLFVLPTIELEGFGLVTLEAMACGLPVIGTPVGGTREILGKFNTEFLFDDTQPESITKLAYEKCLIIKNNPQRWKQISKQCRKFVEKNYSWEQNIDSLDQLIQRHINN